MTLQQQLHEEHKARMGRLWKTTIVPGKAIVRSYRPVAPVRLRKAPPAADLKMGGITTRFRYGHGVDRSNLVPRLVTARDIIKTVAFHGKFSVKDLCGPSRHYPVAHARQVAMYFIRHKTGLSSTQIGKLMHNRDHATVLHAVKNVAENPDKYQPLLGFVRGGLFEDMDPDT